MALGPDDLVERARAAIADRLDGNGAPTVPTVPTVKEVARALGLSSRTLHRRLSERRQSVSRLLDEVRRERVLSRLSRGETPKSIAIETGFGDVPALYRAFRRWTGTTPCRFRTETLGTEAG